MKSSATAETGPCPAGRTRPGMMKAKWAAVAAGTGSAAETDSAAGTGSAAWSCT